MGIRIRVAVLAVVVGFTAVVPTAAATASEPPGTATSLPIGTVVGSDTQEPQARLATGSPALVRRLARVLPTLRRMPVGTSIERVPPGNGERCPGVPARGPKATASVVRSFRLPGDQQLVVQAVAFERPRQAQRALEVWFRQNLRDCRRFSIDEFTFVNRRTRPPCYGIGDARAAYRTRITYDDPTFGRIHAAERVTAAYRDGRYLILAASTGVLAFIGDAPEPDFARWADSIDYMWNRAGSLPR